MVARRCSQIALATQRRLVEHFVAGTPARVTADFVGVHRNSAMLFYQKLREVMLGKTREAQPSGGEVDLDESHFGGVRRGNAAGGGDCRGFRVLPVMRERRDLPHGSTESAAHRR